MESLKASRRVMLLAISELRSEGYEATIEGLSKLLKGVSTEEISAHGSSSLFGFLPSLTSKKLKNRFHWLVREGYIRLQYDGKRKDYFLALSPKGEAEVANRSLPKKKRSVSKAHENFRGVRQGD
jgi:hypothetical protein